MDVRAPGGESWTVKRRWLHRDLPRLRRRRREEGRDWSPLGDVADLGDDLFGGIFLVIGLVVFAVLAVLFVFPAVVFVLELFLVLLLVGVGIVGRLLLGRPWTVRATSATGRVVERQAKGWRGSGRAVEELAAGLRAGRLP